MARDQRVTFVGPYDVTNLGRGAPRRWGFVSGVQNRPRTVRPRTLWTLALALTLATGTVVSCGDDNSPGRPPADTPAPLEVGEVLAPNERRTWELNIHCGARFLSYRLNGKWWRTAEATGAVGWVPLEWPDAASHSGVTVVLEINTAGDELKVTHAGRTVVYTPTEITDADMCA